MICPKCGTENNPGNVSCKKCVYDLTKRKSQLHTITWGIIAITVMVFANKFLHSNSAINLPFENENSDFSAYDEAAASLSRQLQLVSNGEPGTLAQAFLDFIYSEAGRAIVSENYITVE